MNHRDPVELRQSLRGVVVPVVTPFTPAGDIDEAAFDGHVDWLVEQGVHGILPADLVGEAWALTMQEKASLFRRAVQVVAGRVPVIAKLSETALRSQLYLAEAASAAGVDLVKVALPVWPTGDDDQDYRYLIEAVAPGGLPFAIETNGLGLSMAVLDRLADDPRFVGLEETSQDLGRFALLVERYGQRGPVFCGSEDVLAFHLLLGGGGLMTACPNFAPEFMLMLWQAAVEVQPDRLLDGFARLGQYRSLLAAELRAGRPAFASYAKAALGLIGRPVGMPRPPLRPLTPDEREAFAAVLFSEGGLGLTAG